MPVIAPATPGECFSMAVEASRLLKHDAGDVPVGRLRGQRRGALARAPPPLSELPDISVPNAVKGEGIVPPVRPRSWRCCPARGRSSARPAEHRIKGLEKFEWPAP
ncbi:MAG: hypothetical protein U0838_07060 [Chloroflexota bacterium]